MSSKRLAAFAAEVAARVRVLNVTPEVAADKFGEAVFVDPVVFVQVVDVRPNDLA